ncbi:MAG: hypothetical protein QM644_14955 [Mobilitalea sp.]
MSKVNHIIDIAFSAIIFCLGAYLLLNNAAEYQNTLVILRENYKDQEILEQENRESLDIVSYGELVATLYNELDYNIKINNVLIERNSYDPEDIQNYEISKSNYKKNYTYNDNGEILLITYAEIKGKE